MKILLFAADNIKYNYLIIKLIIFNFQNKNSLFIKEKLI